VPYQDFPTADGHMIVTVGNNTQFASFATVLGQPHWARDERFATNPQRVRHRELLVALIREATLTRSTDEWVSMMEAANVPCGPINTLDRVFANPQVLARGLRIEMPHAAAPAVPLVGNPIRLSESPVVYRRAPPALGQHTAEVLADWLQLDPTAVERLRGLRIL
jgi:crotonobetainyl-CoA:carnitine CoA-transferase CaiB-like acyl-CoA transferase